MHSPTDTPHAMADATPVDIDPEALRAEIRRKYAEVALDPSGTFHFHTGRPLTKRLAYPANIIAGLPDSAVASFAGVDNPFQAGSIPVGANVVDLGSGGGLDCFVAADLVGPSGHVLGIDMTPEMVDRATREATGLGLHNVEFRTAILEDLPIEDGWADVVIANGVLNLVADKVHVLREARRVLRPGGVLQFADIAVGRTLSAAAKCDIELWTDCIAGGLSLDEWAEAVEQAGFTTLAIGFPTDAFGGAPGEARARANHVYAHTFRAVRP